MGFPSVESAYWKDPTALQSTSERYDSLDLAAYAPAAAVAANSKL